jgi:hypothetical protein
MPPLGRLSALLLGWIALGWLALGWVSLAVGMAAELEPTHPPGRVWYVDNTAPEGGDGSLVAPFETLARALHAADRGDTLYVFRGDGTARGLDGGVRLAARQRLIGSGVAFAAPGEDTLPAGEPPLLAAHGAAVVTLADDSTIAGVRLGGSARVGVLGEQVRGITVDRVSVDGGGGLATGVLLRGVGGARLSAVTVVGARQQGVRMERTAEIVIDGLHVDQPATGDQAATGDLAAAALYLQDPAGSIAVVGASLQVRDGAALAIEAGEGRGVVSIQQGVLRGDPGAAGVGLRVRTSSSAVLELRLSSTVLRELAGSGVAASATGESRLHLHVAGNGFTGEVRCVEAVAVHVAGSAQAAVELIGNDLLARDAAVLLTAAGDAVLRAAVTDNAVAEVVRGRGVAVVLAERAEADVLLERNRLTGHRAEAALVTAGGHSRLALAIRDNAMSTVSGTPPAPTLLLQARDEARFCLSLVGNHGVEGIGEAPVVLLRQLGAAALALAGDDPARGEPAVARLTTDNRLGRIELQAERPLAAAAGLVCPPPPAPPPLPVDPLAPRRLVEDGLVGLD